MERPELLVGDDYVYEIFQILCGSRGWVVSMAGAMPTAIPLSEIEAWMRLNYIDDPDERAELLYLIREMDAEFLSGR